MRITAKMILDSLHPVTGRRLSTMELEYPRFIHAEFMTHRVFSRNASSSRAIPVERMIRMALEDPAFFVHIGENRPGMQAHAEIPRADKMKFLEEWVELGEIVASYVRRWSEDLHLHKQVANRALEPWHHIKVLVSSTRWSNFFKLRDHEDAQPEIRRLAQEMIRAMMASVPVKRQAHLPYVSDGEVEQRGRLNPHATTRQLMKVSAARCARVSYWNHDGTPPNLEKDLQLFAQLCERPKGSDSPKHLSPLEHVAVAADPLEMASLPRSNFHNDWTQFRKEFE